MSNQDQENIELMERIYLLAAGIMRRLHIVLMSVILLPVLVFFLAITADREYITYTTILIQEASEQNPFLKDLTVATNLKERMPGLNALVHSRHILVNVGRELGYLDEDSDVEDQSEFVAFVSKALKVNLVGEELIRIEYTSDRSKGMVPVIEAISRHFIERIMAPERSALASSEKFLVEQIHQRHEELLQSEQTLADFKSLHAIELPELHASNVSRLVALRSHLVEKNTELAGAKAELDAVRQKLTQANPLLGILEKEILELRARRAALRARFTDEHSEVRAVDRVLSRLEEERNTVLREAKPLTDEELDRLWNFLSASGNESDGTERPSSLLVMEMERLHVSNQRVRSLEHEVKSITEELKQLNNKVSAFGQTELMLKELDRDLYVKRQVYEDLVERSEMAQVTRALERYDEAGRVKIIDPPVQPFRKPALPMLLQLLIGLFAGLVFGLSAAGLLAVLDTSVQARSSLERLVEVPVLARIPRLSRVVLSQL